MEIIKYLGEKLSEKVNISPPAARGLLKLAIKDEIGPFKPYFNLKLEDFELVITNSLKIRLINLNFQESENIVQYLIDELNKAQSLITLGKI
ncbi:MAG: hypothetical protein EU532_01485 [Promethearchaeota archaeon]|nr:MAG: hypothetical protein EU532_01485 [Candidatus Lokiarchaeota archaeon]